MNDPRPKKKASKALVGAQMPKERYLCTREELKALLQATCTTVLEVLDTTVHEPQAQIMRREITAAVDAWCQQAIFLMPQPLKKGKRSSTTPL